MQNNIIVGKQPVLVNQTTKMKLTENNFLLYSASNYNNPSCTSTEEFLEDLKRVSYLKKLFSIYQKTGELRERLILNHLVVLFNVFNGRALIRMLFFKLNNYLHYLVPFLIIINRLPEYVDGIDENIIVTSNIIMDINVSQKVRNILKEGQ